MSIAQFSLLRGLRSRPRVGWIGIDIGSHSVKVAQLELVNGRKQIAESAIFPVPASAELTADSLSTGWLTQLLRDELSHHRGFRGRNVACGLSMSVSEFRSLNIPPGSPKERREMIAQELAENGIGVSNAIEFDFWDSDSNPAEASDADTLVNVLSISDGLASQIAEATQRSGLNCQVLDGAPFALARAIAMVSEQMPTGQPIAVLDWGHRAAYFSIIVAGQPVFSRSFKDCGVGGLVAAVGRGLDLSQADCHQLLSTCGVANPQLDHSERTELQELVDDFACELFDQLIVELDKTLSYLRTQRAELIPSEMWLVGGGATIRNVESKLSFETGIPVAPWRLPRRAGLATGVEGQSIELLSQAAALSELGWES